MAKNPKKHIVRGQWNFSKVGGSVGTRYEFTDALQPRIPKNSIVVALSLCTIQDATNASGVAANTTFKWMMGEAGNTTYDDLISGFDYPNVTFDEGNVKTYKPVASGTLYNNNKARTESVIKLDISGTSNMVSGIIDFYVVYYIGTA